MRYARTYTSCRGVSFIEVLVAAAILVFVFGGLFFSFQSMIEVIGRSKAEAGALALANERLEYIRSLAYDSIGTVGGIPDGSIPQNSTTTLNGIQYTERVLVQYVDAPEDGSGVADANGILSDFKRVKVEISWDNRGTNDSISLITNMVPQGIETTAGGGTLTVNVFDATVQPVSGASVRVYNNTTTSTIDTTVFTNTDGRAIFAGAPAAANYEITVTNTGYSTDQTYTASSSNPNPITPHVAVLQSEVSTMNFQIDELSDVGVITIAPSTAGSFSDTFSNGINIFNASNTVVSSDGVILDGGPGAYAATGTLLSTSTEPSPITSWALASFTASTSATTSIHVQVYRVTGTSTYTLIPDVDLPGNSTGFTLSPIDLSGVSIASYPKIALGGTLTTSDPNITPELLDWTISHIATEPAIPNINFTLTSNKTIGTTASASPVYKYQESHTTDGTGDIQLSDLEYDIYDVAINTAGYDISEACSDVPYVLDPGVDEQLKLTLVAATTYSLRVVVEDIDGDPIPGATVDLTRTAFSDSGTTSLCGQVFFNAGLVSATDYQVDVSASGYSSETVTDVEIEDTAKLVVVLNT